MNRSKNRTSNRFYALPAILIAAVLILPFSSANAAPLTVEAASAKATEKFGGQVIKTERKKQNGRPVYAIRLLTEGRIKEIIIDRDTGKLLSPNKE